MTPNYEMKIVMLNWEIGLYQYFKI